MMGLVVLGVSHIGYEFGNKKNIVNGLDIQGAGERIDSEVTEAEAAPALRA